MSDIILAIGKLLIKGLLWLLNLILGDTYTLLKVRFTRWIRRKLKLDKKKYETVKSDDGLAYIGGRKTQFVIGGGSGEFEYERKAIVAKYDDSLLELPEDLQTIRNHIIQREVKKKEDGLKHMYNTHQVALINAFQTNSDIFEQPYPVFHFKRSDYYNFQATIGSLDKPISGNSETIRQKYIDSLEDIHVPSPILSHGIGIILTVVTSDEKIVITRRKKDTGIRPNELDVSVVEAIDPYMDAKDDANGAENRNKPIDLHKAAQRGLKQELGIEVEANQVHLLGFGMDLEYYQWNIIGTVKTELTSQQVLELKSSGIHGINELAKLEFVPYDTIKVAEILSKESLWSTAQMALYWTMVYDFGNPNKASADRIFKAVMEKGGQIAG